MPGICGASKRRHQHNEFRGLFSYVGAAMAGVPVIMVKNSWAWSGVYMYALIAILLTTLSLALLSRLHRL
ncbi:putative regulatory protein [Salmonella enterica subsp. houtenae]|nr:putative regulatory protein [Salmonella enterica subsp. houtenae]